jgi:hypothetical protein
MSVPVVVVMTSIVHRPSTLAIMVMVGVLIRCSSDVIGMAHSHLLHRLISPCICCLISLLLDMGCGFSVAGVGGWCASNPWCRLASQVLWYGHRGYDGVAPCNGRLQLSGRHAEAGPGVRTVPLGNNGNNSDKKAPDNGGGAM